MVLLRARGGGGARLRVAVIDSGVHADHPHVQGVAGGIGMDDRGQPYADYVDRLGHGTAVTAVIREKAPEAEIWVVKLFDRELAATGDALAAALAWARDQRASLVNLSLGTLNARHEPLLAHEIDAALATGTVIVAAAPDGFRRWLPGGLPGVVSVELDMTVPREVAELRIDAPRKVVVRASGSPRPIPGVPPERNLRGVSFAVANATGLLAQAWDEWGPRLVAHLRGEASSLRL